jgi:murein L,D-transpeptidase YafK
MPRRHLTTIFAACGMLLCMPSAPAHGQLARELGLLPADGAEPGAALRVAALPTESSFALAQLRHERVQQARVASRFAIKRLFHEKGVSYPAAEIFLRIFKRERALELWVRSADAGEFTLLKTYDICAMAGGLGPKRRQGDNQTPEGFYNISFFNPRSDFHLSLHIDYPNVRDRAAGLQSVSLGGDIYIHGGCISEGCLAITDAGIRELYWVSVEARSAGQTRIPVHIFPARLGDADLQALQRSFRDQPDLGRFWASLKPGYDFFEQNRRLPAVGVDARGEYAVNGVSLDGLPALGSPLGSPLGTPLGSPAGAPLGSPAGGAPAAAEPVPGRPLGSPVGG